MQTFDRLAILLGKRDVATDVTSCAARFDATHDVPLCEVLIVKNH
jgi:hypothetical protein